MSQYLEFLRYMLHIAPKVKIIEVADRVGSDEAGYNEQAAHWPV